MKNKKKLPINSMLIIVGLFFFINPNFSVLDILPDFIGAALMVIGFLRLADIDDRAKDASKALTILAFTNAGKMLTLLLLTDSGQTVWPLIFSFCFGIGECALFIYGMHKLFSAVTYQAMRESCEPLYAGFSSLLPLTVLIALLKSILTILPELTSLTTDYGFIENIAGTGAQVNEFVYKALTVLNGVVVTLYGIGWWAYMLRYFKAVGKQKAFLEKLDEKYMEEVGSKHEVLTYRALKTAGLLFTAALIFLLPFRLDGNDFLPDFAAGILLCLGIWRMYALYPGKARTALLLSGGYTLLATAEWVYELLFNFSLNIQDGVGYYDSVSNILLRHPGHLPAYFGLCALSILKYLMLPVALFALCKIFACIIGDHTGASSELAEGIGERKTALIQKNLGVWLNVLRSFCLLAGGAGVIFRLFRMFSKLMIMEYVNPIAAGALLVVFLLFHSKLSEAIDNKYYCARV
ncbi:MAG: hypothetical protein IJ344_05520 [Clostridia bacterium]|nr:hypothetical protein [Clostridia bacterium]